MSDTKDLTIKKEIAYCIQTPEKIADYYQQCISPTSDLYVLSWKNYDSSWENHYDARGIDGVAGRNILTKLALDNGPYRYIVFIDDDVRIDYEDTDTISPFSPLQLFERFLKENEPAVCGIACKTIGHGWRNRSGTHNSIHYLDQQMCAFHIETLAGVGAGKFAIEESWQYHNPPNNAITSKLYPNNKFQYNEIFIKQTYEVRRNYMHYPRNHHKGSKYGDFEEFTNKYIVDAIGPVPIDLVQPDRKYWNSTHAPGPPNQKMHSYHYSKESLTELGFNFESEILKSMIEEWEKIKPDWWESTMKAADKFYQKDDSTGNFWKTLSP